MWCFLEENRFSRWKTTLLFLRKETFGNSRKEIAKFREDTYDTGLESLAREELGIAEVHHARVHAVTCSLVSRVVANPGPD